LSLAVPGLSRGGGLYGSWKKLYVVASCWWQGFRQCCHWGWAQCGLPCRNRGVVATATPSPVIYSASLLPVLHDL
jgi:hypothetical protein